MEKHEAYRREAETDIKYNGGAARELVLTFLERLSNNALPKIRKRGTPDTCIHVITKPFLAFLRFSLIVNCQSLNSFLKRALI